MARHIALQRLHGMGGIDRPPIQRPVIGLYHGLAKGDLVLGNAVEIPFGVIHKIFKILKLGTLFQNTNPKQIRKVFQRHIQYRRGVGRCVGKSFFVNEYVF